MHKDANKIARAIDDAFATLRDEGFFAKAHHTCCQSCGLSEIPRNKESRYVFYHEQDAEDLKENGKCNLAFGSSLWVGKKICKELNDSGLSVSWNGTLEQRIEVNGLLRAASKSWDVTIIQTSVVKNVQAQTAERACAWARDQMTWSDNVVNVQTIAVEDTTVDPTNPVLLNSIYVLGLPCRAHNGLRGDNIEFVGELVQRTEVDLLKIPNLGKGSLADIKKGLARYNLTLKQPHRQPRYKITNRSRQIFEMRQSGKTFREIGDAFGVTKTRAQQIFDKAAEKIRINELEGHK
jgi:hypothetical protein